MGTNYISALAYAHIPMYAGPGAYSKETAYLVHEARRKIYREDIFPQWNGIMLNAIPSLPSVDERGELISVKPIRNLEEFKGVTMRNASPIQASLFEPFGVKPVIISMPEVYMALKTGLVDVAAQGRSSYLTYRNHEVAKYLLIYRDVVEYSLGSYGWAANLGHWEKLPPDIQKIVVDVFNEFQDRIDKDARDENWKPPDTDAINKIMQDAGIIELRFSDEDQAALQQLADKLIAEWLAKADELGRKLYKSDMDVLGRPERYDQLLELGKQLTGAN